ncbi:MAG: DUF6508 domain-containing protein [Actinomycetota bacterium]|nr:DUF6508 domain-containing protein [Actinomycetota bacterium]
MPFERRLSKEALDYLRTMPWWWRDVLDAKYRSSDGKERRLLIALRDNYLNAYADGQSIYKIDFGANGTTIPPRCEIARAFVPGAGAGGDYVIFDGKQAGGVPYKGPETLDYWIKAALIHPRLQHEKVGVAAIAARYPNVIDVEVALPLNGPAIPGAPPGPPQVDIVCLEYAHNEYSDDGVRLAFYEAKGFWNHASLRRNDLCPLVLGQLRTYETALSDHDRRKEVIDAYRNACMILREIAKMRGAAVGTLVHEVATNPWLHLDLDPKPRLVVFRYGPKQPGYESWPRHERALRDSGYKLLLGNSAEDAFVRDEATVAQYERARLAGLARFVPIFTAPGFQFGTMHRGRTDASGITDLPSYSLSDEGENFVQTVYRLGWVRQFNWSEREGTQKARELTHLIHHEAAESAESQQIQQFAR